VDLDAILVVSEVCSGHCIASTQIVVDSETTGDKSSANLSPVLSPSATIPIDPKGMFQGD